MGVTTKTGSCPLTLQSQLTVIVGQCTISNGKVVPRNPDNGHRNAKTTSIVNN